MSKEIKQFENLTFDDFRKMAADPELSSSEKIGFPDSYRAGKEKVILEDILSKMPPLTTTGKTVLDIGPGCGELAKEIVNYCQINEHKLILVDSKEMLDQIADEPFITKIEAYYPDCESLFREYRDKVDCIITYSVFHYIFVESNIWQFMDLSFELLAPGGHMLVGDIPNYSKRRRFFSSEAGVRFHQEYTGTNTKPEVNFNKVLTDVIDDSVIFSMLMRARDAGLDSYVLPQEESLPMANRREDIIFVRP